MNDEFLYKFRRSPQPDFSKNLYKKISRKNKFLQGLFYINDLLLQPKIELGIATICLGVILMFMTASINKNFVLTDAYSNDKSIEHIQTIDSSNTYDTQLKIITRVPESVVFKDETPSSTPTVTNSAWQNINLLPNISVQVQSNIALRDPFNYAHTNNQ